MRQFELKRSQFKVSDFLGWQREGSLTLSPSFQRRSVWKPAAKSYFIDSLARGFPAPVIYIRERLDLDRQQVIREVVDGQQRLRTLFSFIDESCLADFRPDRDRFMVKAVHNADLAAKPFSRLPKEVREAILGYEFSTHRLPTTFEDRDVLQMFARLNATGVKLNHQELRNAAYFGLFKTAMYELALEQLERWRGWKVVSEDQIARMLEVEITSDLVMNMIDGLTGKSQSRLDKLYKRFDESFSAERVVSDRFHQTMNEIDALLGDDIRATVYSGEVHFFTLFVYLYDRLYGLGSELRRKRPEKLPKSLKASLLGVSRRFATLDVPANVLDAVARASADLGRRKTRLSYMHNVCDN